MAQCSFVGCRKKAVWTRKEGWIVAPGSPLGDVCEEHHCWEEIVETPLKIPVNLDVTVEWSDGETTDQHTVLGYISQGHTSINVNLNEDLKIKAKRKGVVKTLWFHPHVWDEGLKTGVYFNKYVNKGEYILVKKEP